MVSKATLKYGGTLIIGVTAIIALCATAFFLAEVRYISVVGILTVFAFFARGPGLKKLLKAAADTPNLISDPVTRAAVRGVAEALPDSSSSVDLKNSKTNSPEISVEANAPSSEHRNP